jgi:uncharacterized Zn-finger protein
MTDTLPPPAAPPGAPAPTEVIPVDSPVVACDGGEGPLGHPRVFLRIVGREVMCPYCSRLYILGENAHLDHRH